MTTKFFTLLLSVSLLMGCTLMRESESRSKEKRLIASGFQARAATTPRQQAALAKLTPYRIQTRTRNGSLYYIYADPRRQCAYVGGAKEYATYEKMTQQQQLVEQQEFAAEAQQMNAMEWQDWGPWGPYGGGFGGAAMPERIQ